jgi:dTDP-glucose 4,6-dehydratase
MRNVLVTGGAGFIGSNFIRYLLQTQPDVQIYNIDLLTYAGNRESLSHLPDPARHTLVEGDICDRALVDDLLRSRAVEMIFHFAAETHVDRSILDPGRFVRTNIQGTFTLLEAARQAWLADKILPLERVHFHHVSTDEVYGTLGPSDPAFAETTPYAPNSPYAASKASSDHLVRSYFHTFGLPVTITNCSNNYGPCQFPEKLIPLVILNAVEGRPLPVYGDGRQVRDWLFVDDHCDAIWQVATRASAGQTYNVGGDNQPPNIEIIRRICAILDELQPDSTHCPHEQLIQYVADRPGHDRRYDMNIGRIRADLGWQPRQSLDSGLRQTVEWYLTHPEWVGAVRSKPDFEEWMDANYARRGGAR